MLALCFSRGHAGRAGIIGPSTRGRQRMLGTPRTGYQADLQRRGTTLRQHGPVIPFCFPQDPGQCICEGTAQLLERCSR